MATVSETPQKRAIAASLDHPQHGRRGRPCRVNDGHHAEDTALFDTLAKARTDLQAAIGQRIVGQRPWSSRCSSACLQAAIACSSVCLLAGALVQTVADALGLSFGRVQLPDLMPADITGTEVLHDDKASGERVPSVHEGPVFTNLLLADGSTALQRRRRRRSCRPWRRVR